MQIEHTHIHSVTQRPTTVGTKFDVVPVPQAGYAPTYQTFNALLAERCRVACLTGRAVSLRWRESAYGRELLAVQEDI